MDIEAEIRDLKRRVNELEGQFGFLTTQIRAVHTDLLEFQKAAVARFDKVDARFDSVERKVDNVERKVGGVDQSLKSLREDLPDIIANAVGEALRRR